MSTTNDTSNSVDVVNGTEIVDGAEVIENFLLDRLGENYTNTYKYFENNKQETIDDFILYFAKLCELTRHQQKFIAKPPIAYLHIGFLRSSLLTGSNEFRIGFHDERLWLDTVESSVYWKGDFLFQCVEPDMDEVKKILKSFPEMSKDEIHEIRYRYAQCYFVPLARQVVQDIILEALEIPEFSQLQLDKNISVLFGGYMEGGEEI